jgi:hypothetical protein
MKIRLFGTEHPTFDDMRNFVQKSNQELIQTFDDALKSRWLWGKQRTNLKMIRSLIILHTTSKIDSLNVWEYIGKLDNAVRVLSDEIGKVKGISKKDYEKLQKKMDALLENPAVKIVADILARNEEATNKINARREKLIRDSVV